MRRREFITLLGGAAAAASCVSWPLAARAQQARMPTIGVLVLGSPPPESILTALRDGLRDVGYTEGRNIRLEIRTADGKADRLPEKAAELVRLKVDIIVAIQTPPATAAKQATNGIPIVMAGVGDPVGTGLVASLGRPGGNVTGLSSGAAEVAGKSVELIREVLPSARRIAVLANATDPFTKPYLAQIGAGARSVGMEMEPVMARPAEALDAAFETMAGKGVDAVIIQGSILRKEAVELAMKHRLPSLSTNRQGPAEGGLMSYAASFGELYRETAVYIDKILKGSKPADLPVAFPTKFELVINLKTAKALGITMPPMLLGTADEVIE
jgi:putative tryptophan/tyrosine transport system substrate-binding protein